MQDQIEGVGTDPKRQDSAPAATVQEPVVCPKDRDLCDDMGSAQHTRGRLFSAYDDNGFYEIGSDANSLRIAFTYGEGETAEANARRLVACWNACEGISTEALEADRNNMDGARTTYEIEQIVLPTVQAQRDELVATIIAAASLAHHGSPAKQLLDDAIARMKGGAA